LLVTCRCTDTCTETAPRSSLGPHPGTLLHSSHRMSYIHRKNLFRSPEGSKQTCHLPNFRGWLLGDLNSDGIGLPSSHPAPFTHPNRQRHGHRRLCGSSQAPSREVWVKSDLQAETVLPSGRVLLQARARQGSTETRSVFEGPLGLWLLAVVNT
jgi:hypothetical protein